MDDGTARLVLRRGKEILQQHKSDWPALLRNKPPVQLAVTGATNPRPLNVKAGLEPFTEPLDAQRARHLLRRTRLGAPIDLVNPLIGQNSGQAVENLVDAALDTVGTPFPDEPVWANEPLPGPNASQEEFDAFIQNNIEWLNELQDEWFTLLMDVGIRERMTLFWHNHFVTQYDDYFLAMHAYRYEKLLREHAFGNFKTFVHAIGTDPAMLVYLDSSTNRVGEPNENYGRELLELFTMGQEDKDGASNYSQGDIAELSRALTGWIVDYVNHTGVFVDTRFDAGDKTIFGQTGAFGYDEAIDLIFAERSPQIAYFICTKLYKEFVYAVPDPVIVQGLADEMLAQDFEIVPVLKLLLKSAHFFDPQIIGARISSPIELLTGMPQNVGMPVAPERISLLRFVAAFLEQNLLNPPNVAGWPGYRSWLSTTSLPIRWLVVDYILFGEGGQQVTDLVSIAEQFDLTSDPNAAFKLPVALAEYILAVPLENLDIGTVSEEFGGDLINFPIPQEILDGPQHHIDLAKIFLGGVPWYEWSLESELAPAVLALYVRYLSQLPEFHLT